MPIEPDFAYKYEATLTRVEAKRNGVFYTPFKLVERMTLEGLRLIQSKQQTVLDPACGAGLFLASAFGIMSEKANTASGALSIFRSSIFGIDKDEAAVQKAREALRKMILDFPMSGSFHQEIDEALSRNILARDSLEMPLADWHALFPNPFRDGGFSLVIGNPPYGLSRDGKLSGAEIKNLKSRFSGCLNGKPNKYLAFTALGTELLSAGGVLSFVIPNSWLGIKDGLGLRTTLIKDGQIVFLDTFESDVFNPAVEVVVLIWKKDGAGEHLTLRRFAGGDSNKHNRSIRLPIPVIKSDPEFKISPNWEPKNESALSTIRFNSTPISALKDIFNPHIAVQAYALGKGSPPQTKEDVKSHKFHAKEPKDKNYLKYLNGSDIGRFSVSWSGEFIAYGPWLSEFQPVKRFTAPRIAVREITAKRPYLIQAAALTEPAVYNKSILNINLGPQGSEQDLYALLAVLNSKLGSFVVLAAGRKTQRRKFPKLVLADLKDFPYPNGKIAKLAKIGRVLMRGDPSASNSELDEMVFEAFNISDSERKHIENSLAANESK